jgi:fumarate hydratase subunit alpha
MAKQENWWQPDIAGVETIASELYVRALKQLPPDIKQGLARLTRDERHPLGQQVLADIGRNIQIAERDNNLLCQDTGIPIYQVTIGRDVQLQGSDLLAAIRRGCERATVEHPLRSSVVHPLTRQNRQTSCGPGVPVISVTYDDQPQRIEINMIPKGSGSENQSWLKMALPSEGVDAIRRFVVDCALAAGSKPCPPTIIGVGVGGTADLCVQLAKKAATRALGSHCSDPDAAALETTLSQAVNHLGIGAQGLGGDATSFAVHIELAATHITLNPVAVNIQCHCARRAQAVITPDGITYGF